MGKKLDREISEAATLGLIETLERIKEQEHLTNKGVIEYLDSKGTTCLLKVWDHIYVGMVFFIVYKLSDNLL